jgi:hypothetical protein
MIWQVNAKAWNAVTKAKLGRPPMKRCPRLDEGRVQFQNNTLSRGAALVSVSNLQWSFGTQQSR